MVISPTLIGRRGLARLGAAVLLLPLLPLGFSPRKVRAQMRVPASFGGVVGEIDRDAMPMPPWITRGLRPELLDLVPPAEPGPLPFPGRLRAWLNRADACYRFGDTAQIGVESTVAAFVQVLGADADGRPVWLFPPDVPGVPGAFPTEAEAVRPDVPLLLPRPEVHRFVLRIGKPAGAELVFVIASVRPMPLSMRNRLKAALGGAQDVAASQRALREGLSLIAREAPELRLTHVGLPYTAEPRGPPVPHAPSAAPARALEWLPATAEWEHGLALALPSRSFAAGERLTLRVRTERPCQLLVLALGNGGQIDVLYPNARQARPLDAREEIEVPGPGADLRLRLRGARFDEAEEERLLVIARPVGATPPFPPPEPGVATLSFPADSASGRALADMLRAPEAGRVVGDVRYVVAPQAAR